MTAAIIVAAGRGLRMGPGVDKLFLTLAGAPVALHTWARWEALEEVSEIVLVIRAGMEQAFHEMAAQGGFHKPYRLAIGGAERQDSVWAGLSALGPGVDLVAIHDGARPCVDPDLARRCLAAAREHGAAVAAQRAVDTIKESEDGHCISRHLDRSRLWSVQTPQCFRRTVIVNALETARAEGRRFTDDTAACAGVGQIVRLVESTAPNPKVTTPDDLPWIEQLLSTARR